VIAHAPRSDPGDSRDRRRALSFLSTIRGRLYLAFGFAAGMTVVGSSFALFAAGNIGTTLTEIVSRSMPATVESLRLSAETGSLVDTAPRLMAVEDQDQRQKTGNDIEAQVRGLRKRIDRLRTLDAATDDIEMAQAGLVDGLRALDRAVSERIEISDQRRALARAARDIHEKFLEAIIPVTDDANFDLMMRDHASTSDATLNQSIDSLRRLLQLQADTNLLAGLLIEASMVNDISNLPPIRDNIASARRSIEANLQALAGSAELKKIAALCQQLSALAGGGGIVERRSDELKHERDAQVVFAAALAQADRLKRAVDGLIERHETTARSLSAHAIAQITVGRFILVLLSLAALAAAATIAWLYVGRSIVGRLTLLAQSMRQIAEGKLEAQIPVGGRDEIAAMAQALVVFRQATRDVSLGRQREADRARDSERQRETIAAATREFERAVNDIVQGLDGASKTMDACAKVMTDTAGNNQAQADATKHASEEAMGNVDTVAMAAEEIALSAEEIAKQAGASAAIARRATGEAQAIIGAVEQLTSAVGQINQVSNLIRDVAAQTNLLALNATIEAARAGDAGRGFAVVAQEVKGLAAQTEQATGDITRQISTIEMTTAQVVQAMKAIAGTIEQLDKNANDISIAVQQQDGVSKEIARSAVAAAARTREVSGSLAQVSDAAARTGEVANSVLHAGDELAARSGRLRAEVERFLAQVRIA